jgi:4-hydroxythreonine-4-phosphate dehydrogenase
MIHVSQGYEGGIGLEIFIKSWLSLTQKEQAQFILYVDPDTIQNTLESLNISYHFNPNSLQIGNSSLSCFYLQNTQQPQATESLSTILERINNTDILITLPARKKDFIFQGKNLNGHTEFFREHYKNSDISMFFKGLYYNVCLITDHIPLKEVPKFNNLNKIKNKIDITLKNYKKYFGKIDELIFSGINPHCGENGLLGKEDKIIQKVVSHYKNANGPISADMMHLKLNEMSQIFFYFYHDQGLAPFKLKHGLIGANITFGLPFIRLSVDHGTAEDLFCQDVANYSSQIYINKLALELNKERAR